MADLHSPPHNKAHTWILVLLFWIVALLVFVAAYLIYSKDDETPILSGAELATQCTAAGFVDAATVPDGETSTCPELEAQAVSFDAPFSPMSFEYYQGWHVLTVTDGGTGENTVHLSLEPLSDCTECSGQGLGAATIIVNERKLASGENGLATQLLGALQGNSMITVTRNETSDDGHVSIIGWTDNTPCEDLGCSTGTYQEYFFERDGWIVRARISTSSSEALEGWSLFTESFDTSIYK